MEDNRKNILSHTSPILKNFKDKLIGPVDFERIEKRLITNSQITLGYLLMLLAACMIALLGLLMNSSAVIIGAMLISPLMDPILGGAFSIATMNRSENIKNVARMAGSIFIVGIFVLIFMKISPISDMTSEIMARTKPNLFDLFVALFAAVAGTFVLVTGQGGNTIPGVAIATALMPPLVTIFYGISIRQWGVARGAAYLFITNFATITFAATLILWFVGFKPKYEEKKRLYIIIGRQFAVFLMIILLLSIPLTRTLITISRQARITSQTRKAVYTTIKNDDKGINIVRVDIMVGANNSRMINLGVETPKYITSSKINEWQKEISIRTNSKTKLNVSQISVMSEDTGKMFASLTPGASNAHDPEQIGTETAISTLKRSFGEARSALLNSSKSIDTICDNIYFSLEENGIVKVTCKLPRPAAIPVAWRDEAKAILSRVLDTPVQIEFIANVTKWQILSLYFKNGRETPNSDAIPCEQMKPPAGLKASYEIKGYNDGVGDSAGNIRLTQRRQKIVASMLEACDIDKGIVSYGAVTSTLSKTPAEADVNRRVEVWITVKMLDENKFNL